MDRYLWNVTTAVRIAAFWDVIPFILVEKVGM
jgi:hypothetical protein